ncbi:oligosaccharide flippase family protein [Larkinella insperata]|uniref:Oligosaccharide flippase family protein n=1 Tax=Larkinella insperata TaxID=332158 RepID=A0ABW3Q3E8_9BACT|nr:oligosaccharide flippase family protein [Larkinella insperata]
MASLYKNSVSGVLQFIFTSVLTFVSIPLFIQKLGIEAYGAFSLITLLGNLNILANLGLNVSLIKFISEQGKTQESNYDIIVSCLIIVSVIIPISTGVLIGQTFILKNLMGFSAALADQVKILYLCVVLANIFLLVGQLFAAVLDSQQYIYLNNIFQGIYSALYWGGSIAAITTGFGMTGIGVAILGSAITWSLLVTVYMFKKWGALSGSGLSKNVGRVIRKQFAHASKLYSSSLISLFFEPLTKIMVSRMVGVSEVGYLEVAYKIRTQLWSLVTKATYPLYPKIALENNRVKVAHLILNFQALIAIGLAPLITLFVFLLKDTLILWIGSTNPIVISAALWISTTYLVGTIAIPVYYYLMSKEHAGKTLWLQSINVVVNCLIIFSSYRILGVFSAVLGNSLAILSSLCLSLLIQQKYVETVQINWRGFGKLVIIFVAGCLLTYTGQSYLQTPLLRLVVGMLIIAFFYSTLGYFHAPQLMRVYNRIK